MALILNNLTPRVRQLMIEEINMDATNGNLYISSRLSLRGKEDYIRLLREAAEAHDDIWLSAEIGSNRRLNEIEQRRKPSGGVTNVRVPVTAAETMGEGEFNRFYVRGLCRFAIETNVASLEVYRAKSVVNPRQESQSKIGSLISPSELLRDLRVTTGVEPALGIPPGPNSGLSVQIPIQLEKL